MNELDARIRSLEAERLRPVPQPDGTLRGPKQFGYGPGHDPQAAQHLIELVEAVGEMDWGGRK